ncbi:MAG: hypothetical protein REI11_20040 [Patulibacter sp.]|nr:hypothetical protein [Patulibacter sp.]
MADLFLDEFNGPPGSVAGHDAGGGHLWAAPFTGGDRLFLSGFGSLVAPPGSFGDAQIRISEFASADEYELELKFGGPLTDTLEVEYGVQSVGDLTPGNYYINISNAGCSVRWYTKDPNQNFSWPDTIVENTTITFRFTNGAAAPRLTCLYEGEFAFAYGTSDFVMADHIWKMATGDAAFALLSLRAGTPTPPEPSAFWTSLVGATATLADPAPPPEA